MGRYHDVRREERFCDKCNSEQVGDEYHVLFQCQNQYITQLRNKYIPEYYRVNANHRKYIKMMQCSNVHFLNNLSQFIKLVLRMFT